MIYSNFDFPKQPKFPHLDTESLSILGQWELTKGQDRNIVNHANIAAAVAKRPLAQRFVLNMEGWEPTAESLEKIKEWLTAIRAASGRPTTFWNNRKAHATADFVWPDEFYSLGDFYIYGMYLTSDRPSVLDWFSRYPQILQAMRESVDPKPVVVTISPIIFGKSGTPSQIIETPNTFWNICNWTLVTGHDLCVWALGGAVSDFEWNDKWTWFDEYNDILARHL